MTQAYNLSQLANKVNTSGQLDASTGLVNITPVANGGTGKSTNTSGALLLGAGTSAMTELSGATAGTIVYSSGAGWTAQPAGIVGGNYVFNAYTSPATWTRPANLKSIKVTVVGGGGNGGSSPGQIPATAGGGGGGFAVDYIPAPSLTPTVTITAGAGTNSFGALASATAGANGTAAVLTPALGGIGSNGIINTRGQSSNNAIGGSSAMGFGGIGTTPTSPAAASLGVNGLVYGGGGAGAGTTPGSGLRTGGTGANGIVIVEEFY